MGRGRSGGDNLDGWGRRGPREADKYDVAYRGLRTRMAPVSDGDDVMTPCRAYWMCVGLLVAFNAMVWLAIANEMLRRADGPQGRSRVTRETLITGGPPEIYDFEHLAPNGGTTAYISGRD